MKAFTQLFTALDETNRTNEKVAALENYFRAASAPEAAWALYFLCGRKIPRVLSSTHLRQWIAEAAGLPLWLVEESYEAVGDLAETAALLLPDRGASLTAPLHELVATRLLPLATLPEAAKKALLLETWEGLDARERLVWNKIITGSFRVGVAQTLVVRALAQVARIEPAIMAHRLAGRWAATPADYERLLAAEGESGEPARPYPFYLAAPLEAKPETLGELAAWQCEWKWDGMRAQLIRRQNETLVWSRGDEMVTETFPEIADIGRVLPEGTVLDGEILAWQNDGPAPFARLQRRLGRTVAGKKLRAQFPVVFLAYDLLECEGADWRSRPLAERRARLEEIVGQAQQQTPVAAGGEQSWETADLFAIPEPPPSARLPLHLSACLQPASWSDLERLQGEARGRQVEGVMLKRRDSVYGVGRQRGAWWKWKIDPLTIDAVLIGAQRGHGRRASLYTDYTFGLWQEGRLVPVAKAYSGLSDEEILAVDEFVRKNTVEKFGPLRTVKAELVFELAFEGVQVSTRHKAGLAVRFPRMARWRHDKKFTEADTLDSLRALMNNGAHD